MGENGWSDDCARNSAGKRKPNRSVTSSFSLALELQQLRLAVAQYPLLRVAANGKQL